MDNKLLIIKNKRKIKRILSKVIAIWQREKQYDMARLYLKAKQSI